MTLSPQLSAHSHTSGMEPIVSTLSTVHVHSYALRDVLKARPAMLDELLEFVSLDFTRVRHSKIAWQIRFDRVVLPEFVDITSSDEVCPVLLNGGVFVFRHEDTNKHEEIATFKIIANELRASRKQCNARLQRLEGSIFYLSDNVSGLETWQL